VRCVRSEGTLPRWNGLLATRDLLDGSRREMVVEGFCLDVEVRSDLVERALHGCGCGVQLELHDAGVPPGVLMGLSGGEIEYHDLPRRDSGPSEIEGIVVGYGHFTMETRCTFLQPA